MIRPISEWKDLFYYGFSPRDIAVMYGVCAYTARKHLKEAGVVSRPTGRTKVFVGMSRAEVGTMGRIRKSYGISLEELESMKIQQSGLCAICHKVPTGKGKNGSLHIDHDHKTKKVRQLLCGKCNTALGYFNEDPELLKKVRTYLLKHSQPSQSLPRDLPQATQSP